ncbi:MAG: hypothetical protein IH948_07425 [Bacteroidetes bacterium]|nr:hypothetical protein [Bacteroidota bacterium]
MNTKLTLTIKKEIIERAKVYASTKSRSLSEMVENYFKYLTQTKSEVNMDNQISPRVERLRGSLKVDSDFNYKQILDDERNKKHGI